MKAKPTSFGVIDPESSLAPGKTSLRQRVMATGRINTQIVPEVPIRQDRILRLTRQRRLALRPQSNSLPQFLQPMQSEESLKFVNWCRGKDSILLASLGRTVGALYGSLLGNPFSREQVG